MKTKTIKETYTVVYKKTILTKKDQKEILSKVIKILKPVFKDKSVEMVLLGGSLSKMEMGEYDKRYRGKKYSDIDIIIVADKRINLPKKFIENYKLPEHIVKTTRAICYRYVYTNKLKSKFPLHVHVFNTRIHNKKLALKNKMPVNGRGCIVLYKKAK